MKTSLFKCNFFFTSEKFRACFAEKKVLLFMAKNKIGVFIFTGTVYRNQGAALIHPFIPSFFFLSNFQTLKFFITFLSGTVRPRRLKLVTHVDNGLVNRVYRNHAAAHIHPFISSVFFLPNFQALKNFRHTFLRNCEAQKIETWYSLGQRTDVSCLPESGCCCCLFVPLFRHFSFSPIFRH